MNLKKTPIASAVALALMSVVLPVQGQETGAKPVATSKISGRSAMC